MRFVYPGFSSYSEFVAGYHGDCGPTAILMALHVLNPAKWPLTPDTLKALVEDIQRHNDAGGNGAENVPQMDGYLHAIGIAHTTVGYAAFNLNNLHIAMKNLADPAHRQLVIVEWSKAGAGLHDDEPGVQYHYSAFGGIDTGAKNDGVGGGYLRGDGDSNTDSSTGAPTAPILTRWDAIVAAAPIGYVLIPVPVPAPPPPPPAPKPSAIDTALNTVKADLAALEAAIAAAKV